MNLQLLCKINGVIIGLNGLSAIFMYNTWFNMAGIEATGPTISLVQAGGGGVGGGGDGGAGALSWAQRLEPRCARCSSRSRRRCHCRRRRTSDGRT